MNARLLLGDCLNRMKDLPAGTIHRVICDPPYDLTAGTGRKGFMGKSWDGTGIAFSHDLWASIHRVLAVDGLVKVFGGTRTFHRMAVAMEDVGFSGLHFDSWGYGSGFPKSLNVGKALDKAAGAERGTKRIEYTGNAVLRSGGQNTRPWMEEALEKGYHELADDTPVTDLAILWNGWGTALKPAWEPILVGSK